MFGLLIAVAMLGGSQTEPSPATGQRKEPKLCRTYEITGSRIGVRTVCKTKSEWDLEKQQAEQFLSGRRDISDPRPSRPAG